MGADVFLSYVQADEPFARQLAHRLRSDGVRLAHIELAPKEDLEESLVEGISDSQAVVLVISRKAIDSAWLMQELGMASVLAKRVVVVRPDSDPLPISFLSRVQVLDAGDLSPDQAADTIRAMLTP